MMRRAPCISPVALQVRQQSLHADPGGCHPMDPLGARSCFLDVDALPCWGAQEPDGTDLPDSSVCSSFRSPFPCREDINSKVILWRGEVALLSCTAVVNTSNETLTDKNPVSDSIYRYAGPELQEDVRKLKGEVALLSCTAVVNTSNETLTDKNPVSDSIYRYAGPELQEDVRKLKGCRTGEAKLTKGFNLAARYIIHTVGPKYKSKYRTAAESSLYSCYRNVLQLAKEQAMSSVGLCVVSTQKRCYPLEDAAHIALRTVRRFLESHGSALEKVVFAVTEQEEATYLRLLPLYFPRSPQEEQSSLPLLPPDIGNADGEPVVPERQIRISEKPGAPDDDVTDEDEGLEHDLSLIGSHAFARMEGDVDKQRRLALQGQMSGVALQKQHQRNYNRWLSRARTEDLSDIAALKALYQSGVDSCGRTVVVVVGRNIPVLLIDMEKALLYFIHMMDHIAAKEYTLVYFHTLTGEHNHLDSDFLRSVYDVVDAKYKKNLKALYFVHPTFRSKVSSWFFTTFTVSGLKDKVHQVESLHQLFTAIPPYQIEIPPFVLDYDARENGPCFPSHSSFSGL